MLEPAPVCNGSISTLANGAPRLQTVCLADEEETMAGVAVDCTAENAD